jgi:hypothetical protein
MTSQPKPDLVREPMWDVEDIAARLGLRASHVRNNVVTLDGFPIVAKVSGNVRLWWSTDVEAWITEHRPKDVRA